MHKLQIKCGENLAFSHFVYLFNFGKRIHAQLCKTIYDFRIIDHHHSASVSFVTST